MRVCEHTPFRIGWNQDVARLRMWSCRLAKHTPGDVPRKPEHPIKEIKQTNKKMQAEESSHSGFLTWARGRVVLGFFLHPPVNKSKDRESTAHLPMYPLSATPRTVPSNPWILFFFFLICEHLGSKFQFEICPQVLIVPTFFGWAGHLRNQQHPIASSHLFLSCSHTSKLHPCAAPVLFGVYPVIST